MATQSRRGSLVESLSNILVGYWIAVFSQVAIYKYLGLAVTFSTSLWISVYYTVISLIRSYLIRRAFNRLNN